MDVWFFILVKLQNHTTRLTAKVELHLSNSSMKITRGLSFDSAI